MKKKSIFVGLLIYILMSINVLAQDEHQNSKNNSSTVIEQKDKKNDDSVLAIVNGKKIIKSFFDDRYHNLPLKTQKKILARVISSELLVQYTSKHALYNDQEIINKVLKNGNKLKQEGKKFTEEDKRMVLGLTVANILAKEYADNNVTEKLAKEYYSERKNNFKNMKYAKYHSIETTEKVKAQKIIKDLEKAQDKKKTFLNLKSQYDLSTDKKEGILPKKVYKFGRNNNVYNKTLFNLAGGDYNKEPIEFEGNYYIIFSEQSSNSKKIPTYAELEENIYSILKYKKAKEWLNDKVEELKKSSEIVNYLDDLKDEQ